MDPAAHRQGSPSAGTLTRPRPRPEDLVQATRFLIEGLAVPGRYLVGLLDLVDDGYALLYLKRRVS